MFAFISLFLCLSVLLTFTSAQAPPAGPFTIGAYNPDIWGVAGIAANGGLFWIGKDTASYCPAVDGIDCDDYPGDSTVLAGGNDTLSLDVVVPGGQQVYVGPDGALGYTLPHSVYMPNGSVTTGFLRFQSFAGGAPVPMTFQADVNIPPRPRLLPHNLPHPPKTPLIMLKHATPTLLPQLQRLYPPNLLPHNPPPALFQKPHDLQTGLDLPLESKEMQEHTRMHDINLALQQAHPPPICNGKDIAAEKAALKALPVAEQLVAQLQELGVEIHAMQVVGGRAVTHQFAQVLREAAAEVQQCAAGLHGAEQRAVRRREMQTQVEEAEEPDAWICVDFPGFVALGGRRGEIALRRG
ncbi:hypothetical protein B7494_g2386 [Chlorociboria aeruginascens]|nr:hypothetical protein B7494_g2386 [Chlorociboria aeruginascens]